MTFRIRSTGTMVPAGACVETRSDGSVSWQSGTFGFVGRQKTMQDTHDNKRFIDAGKSGSIAMNPMSSVTIDSSCSGVGQVITDVSPGLPTTYSMSGPFGAYIINSYAGGPGVKPYPPVIPAVDASRVNDLIGEVCTDCASEFGRSTYDMWENVAELRQTVALLSDPVQACARFYKTLRSAKGWAKVKEEFLNTCKRGKGETRKGYLLRVEEGLRQLAAGQWLKYRNGILPLVATVNDVVASVKSETTGAEIQSWRASASVSESSSGSFDYSNSTVSGTISWVTNHSVKIRAVAVGRITPTNAFKFGFCSKSLFTLPWELVRLSYVADWVGNIGSVIGALAPSGEASWLGSCYTIEEVISTVYTQGNAHLNSSASSWRTLNQGSSGTWVVTQTTKKRVVGFPPPRLLVRDSFRMSPTRIADATALLSQMLTQAAGHLLGDSSTKRKRR